MPQGDNTPIDKVILQMPGVSYDSAVSNPDFHVRNEYANVQIRINGVVLPEGVSALGPFIDTNFIGSMSLLTGALPAEYGLRTAGVLDITSRQLCRAGRRNQPLWRQPADVHAELRLRRQRRQLGIFRHRRAAIGTVSGWKIRRRGSTPIHDETQQGKFFGYASTLLDESTRFSVIAAASYSAFQIPNNPGQTPARRLRTRDIQILRRSTKTNTTLTI